MGELTITAEPGSPLVRTSRTFDATREELISLDTTTFEDHGDGTTTIHLHAAFRSVEDRDAMVDAGMASGIRESYERLEELLSRSLKARHDAN